MAEKMIQYFMVTKITKRLPKFTNGYGRPFHRINDIVTKRKFGNRVTELKGVYNSFV